MSGAHTLTQASVKPNNVTDIYYPWTYEILQNTS